MILPFLLMILLTAFRLPAVFVHPQFWAEDATVLFVEARLHGWHSLFIPHPAYYIVGTRLVPCAVAGLPALYAPCIYCYTALAFTLLAAWFCLRARLDYLMDRRGRIALALALVLAPQDGEAMMKLIGCQWVLMTILLILMLQTPPEKPRQAIADFLGLLLAGLTGPFVLFYAPWFLVRLQKVTGGRSWYNVLLIGTAWSLAAIQLLSIWYGPNPHPEPFSSDVKVWLRQLGFTLPSGLFFGAILPGYLGRAFYLISPLLLLLVGWALWRGESRRFWPALTLLCCGAVAYAGGLKIAAAEFAALNPFGSGGRYFYPFYVFALWVGILYAYDACQPLRKAAGVAVVMMLASSASDFTLASNHGSAFTRWPDLDWETYARRLDAGQAVEQVPILPSWTEKLPARPTPQ